MKTNDVTYLPQVQASLASHGPRGFLELKDFPEVICGKPDEREPGVDP